jgi:CRISPR-associated protein Cas2
MNLLVAYDIADPRRLQRIARIMEDYGLRVQRSIFEVEVTPAAFAELRRRTEAAMDPAEDGVKYFPACGPCGEVWFNIGIEGTTLDAGAWLIV